MNHEGEPEVGEGTEGEAGRSPLRQPDAESQETPLEAANEPLGLGSPKGGEPERS